MFHPGITGIVLTLIVIVMYVFAVPFARRNLFKAFWFTHRMYVLLYIFMILHGSGRLVQAPLTQNYIIGPLVIFVIDKLISASRKKIEIAVKKAELLPSGLDMFFVNKTCMLFLKLCKLIGLLTFYQTVLNLNGAKQEAFNSLPHNPDFERP